MIIDGQWRPSIGDPTIFGWTTTAGYMLSALSCGIAGMRARSNGRFRKEQPFWWALAILMLFLGINKQLDLQTWLWWTTRNALREGGWYEERIWLQIALTLFVALSGLVAFFVLLALCKYQTRESRVALVGITFLSCFILIRTISISHVDRFLAIDFGALNINHVLEFVGVCIVLSASLAKNLRQPRRTGS